MSLHNYWLLNFLECGIKKTCKDINKHRQFKKKVKVFKLKSKSNYEYLKRNLNSKAYNRGLVYADVTIAVSRTF